MYTSITELGKVFAGLSFTWWAKLPRQIPVYDDKKVYVGYIDVRDHKFVEVNNDKPTD